MDDYLRRRDHSIETAIKVWLKDPKTILVYEGQHLAERHLAEQVTLISAQNEAVTILMDDQTHLPLRRSFEWRDPTLPRQEHGRRGVRRLPRGGWIPHAVQHHALQERRDDPAVLPGSRVNTTGNCRTISGVWTRRRGASRSSSDLGSLTPPGRAIRDT